MDRVLASGRLAQGPETEAFEGEFSTWVEGRHCVAVNSGTAALHLALLAAGVGAGDEVVVPSFTFAATANAVRLCDARPVFVDIEAGSFCLDPGAVDAAVTARTVAVMPVHLYGHPADMEGIGAVAARHGLVVIEDAAQAHGALRDGRPVGAMGMAAGFSFYPTKNMTTGEGGMIVTADGELARRARLLRNQGMERRYHNEVVGFNARMTDIAAAIGRVQLRKLGEWNAARRRHARRFDSDLVGVTVPPVAAGATHVYHQYTIRSHERDLLRQHLVSRGVGAEVYYPVPVHRLAAYGSQLDLPETERAVAEVLSLPVRPDLSDDEIGAIVAAVNERTQR